jgi:hypothetical protein
VCRAEVGRLTGIQQNATATHCAARCANDPEGGRRAALGIIFASEPKTDPVFGPVSPESQAAKS